MERPNNLLGAYGLPYGLYLILKGDRAPTELYGLILDAFRSVENTRKIPGAAPENCGNYRLHDLNKAKRCAKEFVAYLEKNEGNGDIFKYPETERPVTDGGGFYDS